MRIFKFGGASVKDAPSIVNLSKILQENLEKPILIVVSAIGNTTNILKEIAKLAYNRENYETKLEHLINYHNEICLELFGEVPEDVSNFEFQLTNQLNQEEVGWEQYYDAIVPFGELLSSTIVHHFLLKSFASQWIDARRYIKTDDYFTEASVEWELTEQFINRDIPELLEKGPVITQGFIGSDHTGKTTTLGREGSDYTGAIFAYCLNADDLTVWKDVPGLLNADPKQFPDAELFDELSFQEVTELTYYGAKVIHPKTIRPLALRKISLYVRSFIEPAGKGTKIHDHEKISVRPCFVFKENQLLVSLRVRDNSFMDEKNLGEIFMALDHVNVKLNLMHNSALTFTFCMDYHKGKLEKVQDYLKDRFQLLYNEGLQLATIKNYNADSFALLPKQGEFIMEQKTRNNYHVVYRTIGNGE